MTRDVENARQWPNGVTDESLGIIAHELRTPLAAVQALTEFMLTDDAAALGEWAVLLRNLHDQVVQLDEMLGNLLETARLSSGQAKWKRREFRLDRVCDDVVQSIRPLLDPQQVDIRFSVEPPDATVYGDPNAIRRVLLNLASNARKYTAHGRISIRAAQIMQSGKPWLSLTVSDTGAGIDPAVVARLGEPFAINSGAVEAVRAGGGTGLGLAVCHSIVTAFGGSLRIESVPNRGTTASVLLPSNRGDGARRGESAESAALGGAPLT